MRQDMVRKRPEKRLFRVSAPTSCNTSRERRTNRNIYYKTARPSREVGVHIERKESGLSRKHSYFHLKSEPMLRITELKFPPE